MPSATADQRRRAGVAGRQLRRDTRDQTSASHVRQRTAPCPSTAPSGTATRAPGTGTAVVHVVGGLRHSAHRLPRQRARGLQRRCPGPSTASRIPRASPPATTSSRSAASAWRRDADYGGISTQVEFTNDPPPRPRRRWRPDASDACPDQNAAARDANRDGCLDPDPDPDGDGVPLGADKCPTQNAAARDTNRDGCLDPLPPKRVSADASMRATADGERHCVRRLRVRRPRARRSPCAAAPLQVREATRRRAASRWRWPRRRVTVKKLAGRSFRAGQKIRIYVTRKGRIGTYIQYTIKRGGFKRVNRCLKPGSMKPRKRCR